MEIERKKKKLSRGKSPISPCCVSFATKFIFRSRSKRPQTGVGAYTGICYREMTRGQFRAECDVHAVISLCIPRIPKRWSWCDVQVCGEVVSRVRVTSELGGTSIERHAAASSGQQSLSVARCNSPPPLLYLGGRRVIRTASGKK